MAGKYKSGKSNDKVLMYSIIGFVAAIIILSVALVVAQNFESETPPEDLLEYEQFQHLTDWGALDDQTSDVYAVYVYRATCGACASIKQDVLEATANNNSGLKIYLLDTQNVVGDSSQIIFNNRTIEGTPTMLLYRDGELVEMNYGTPPILSFLDDVQNGDYIN